MTGEEAVYREDRSAFKNSQAKYSMGLRYMRVWTLGGRESVIPAVDAHRRIRARRRAGD